MLYSRYPLTKYPLARLKKRSQIRRMLRDCQEDCTKYILIGFLIGVVLCVTLFLAVPALAEEASEPYSVAYVCVSEGSILNGRAEPDKSSFIQARLESGDEVEVVSMKGLWVEVKGGETGTVWCYAEYLSDVPPDELAEKYVVKSNGRVRLRKSPGGKYKSWLENGDKVKVLRVLDGWAYTGKGWIDFDYLEAIEE